MKKFMRKSLPVFLFIMALLLPLGTAAFGTAAQAAQTETKTETVTANLYIPGELNPILNGVTAYMTNPNNPMKGDPIPNQPVSANASLLTNSDGARILTLTIPNEAFTLQAIDNCANGKLLRVKTVDGSFGEKTSRISEIQLELSDDSGTYVFGNCEEYAVPVQRTLNVPLTLQVELPKKEEEAKPADTAALQKSMEEAQKALDSAVISPDGKDIDNNTKWVAQSDVDALNEELTLAKAVLDSEAEQSDVDAAVTRLNDAVSKFYSAAKAGTKAKPQTPADTQDKTQTVTANLYIPGELNPILKDVTAYMTNPNNPLKGDPIPNKPVSENAALTTKTDGTKILTLTVPNEAFTLQKISSCSNAKILSIKKSNGTFGQKTSRISELQIQLLDDSGTYVFKDCEEYAVPVQQTLKVPLTLSVGLSQDTKKDEKQADTSNLKIAIKNAQSLISQTAVSRDGKDVDKNTKWAAQQDIIALQNEITLAKAVLESKAEQSALDTAAQRLNSAASRLRAASKYGTKSGSAGAANTGSTENNGSSSGTGQTSSSTTLSPGTYTVSANIWFESGETGLPLNPHITNSTFPPKDPVSKNATLTVDNSGRCLVTIPITIQSKVMSVKNIKGLNIVDSKTSGGKLTSITVDLGILSSTETVIKSTCTVTIQMGDLAMSISGLDRDHTWTAEFQVNFQGIPASGKAATPELQKLIDTAQEKAKEEAEENETEAEGELTELTGGQNVISGQGHLNRDLSAQSEEEMVTESAMAQDKGEVTAKKSRRTAGAVAGTGIGAGAAGLLAGYLLANRRRKQGED